MSPAEYSRTLDVLLALLRERPMTARQISQRLKCSRPIAYARLRALIARGDEVYSYRTGSTGPGPRPITWGVRC